MIRRVVWSTANKLVGFETESAIVEGEKVLLEKQGYKKLFEVQYIKKLSSSLIQLKNSNITIVLETII